MKKAKEINTKKILICLSIFCVFILPVFNTVFAQDISQQRNILIDDIDFEPDELSLDPGQTVKAYIEIEPRNATNQILAFTSNNPSVATVSADGIITAVSAGRAIITASATDGSNERTTCKVTVNSNTPSAILVDDVEFEPDDVFISVGQTHLLNVVIEPSNATNKALTFSSNNPGVVSVDNNGNAEGITAGMAIITAMATDGSGESDTCTVVVRDSTSTPSVLIEDIDVEPDELSMTAGQTRALNVRIKPANATNQALNYFSSDNTVASVNDGVITAEGPGSAVITVSTLDGSNEYDTCKVTVSGKPENSTIAVTDIDFQEDELFLPVGQSQPVTVIVKPANATNPAFSVENLTDNIISFSNNTVTALKPGTGFLVVRALDGSNLVDVCEVNVLGEAVLEPDITIPVNEIDIDNSSFTLNPGATRTLGIKIEPNNATNKALKYSSNDPMIATVDQNGIVTGVGSGTTTITATATDGSNKADACIVTVAGSQAPNPSPSTPSVIVSYDTHVQNIGWQNAVQNGAISGTSGQSLRLEGIHINVSGNSNLGIEYRTHIENIGWQNPVSNGELSGTTGQALRLEAIQIKLTGSDANLYNVFYRVHAQDVGWMNWAKNGESAGTAHFARRLEAIQIQVLPKTAPVPTADPPSVTDLAFMEN